MGWIFTSTALVSDACTLFNQVPLFLLQALSLLPILKPQAYSGTVQHNKEPYTAARQGGMLLLSSVCAPHGPRCGDADGPSSSCHGSSMASDSCPAKQRRHAFALYSQGDGAMDSSFAVNQQYNEAFSSPPRRRQKFVAGNAAAEHTEEALVKALSSSASFQTSAKSDQQKHQSIPSVEIRLGKPLQPRGLRAFHALGKMAFLSDVILEVEGRTAVSPSGFLEHLAGCSALRKLEISFLPIPPGDTAATLAAADGDSGPWVLPGGVAVIGARAGLGSLGALKHLEALALRGDISIAPCGFKALAGLGHVATLTLWTKAS